MVGVTSDRADIKRLLLLVAVVVICALGGGSSRVDAPLLPFVRALVIAAAAAMLILPGKLDFASIRMPAVLFALFTLLVVLQLLLLPPQLWLALPHHGQYADAALIVGAGQPWRPLSLTPDLTINSLIALAIPAAALIGFAGLGGRQREAVVVMWLAAAAVSVLFGIAQVTGGEGSPFYTYPKTHLGNAVGLLSNRNHQAAWLAATLPMIAAWMQAPVRTHWERRWRRGAAVALALLIFPTVLLAGSRSGIALTLLGVLGAVVILPNKRRYLGTGARKWVIIVGIGVTIAAIALLFSGFGRALAFQRLLGGDYEGELRFVNTPTTIRILTDFFPFGSGFGSFDPVFRSYETDAMLRNTYFNHAHNDLLELMMTGGAAAALLLVAFLWWLLRSAAGLFRAAGAASYPIVMARAATIAIAILLIASLTDYPLRTPLLSMIFVLACALVAAGGRVGERRAFL